MLTINNLDKIVRYPIGYSFRVKSMVCGHTNYHISLIDGKGGCRDLKLNRIKGRRGLYKLSYGNYLLHLKFSDIHNLDLFCAQIKQLIIFHVNN
jgi:hypothetical protein